MSHSGEGAAAGELMVLGCLVLVLMPRHGGGSPVCLGGALSLCACGVGFFSSYRFISVPPVRGGTYFSLPAAKKSRQKKAAQTATAKWAPWSAAGSGTSGICVL